MKKSFKIALIGFIVVAAFMITMIVTSYIDYWVVGNVSLDFDNYSIDTVTEHEIKNVYSSYRCATMQEVYDGELSRSNYDYRDYDSVTIGGTDVSGINLIMSTKIKEDRSAKFKISSAVTDGEIKIVIQDGNSLKYVDVGEYVYEKEADDENEYIYIKVISENADYEISITREITK